MDVYCKRTWWNLPIEIKAVPEGTIVDSKNVLFTIENTDPKCFWLTNYLETLLVQVWCPMTVATNSFHMMQNIDGLYGKTSDSKTPYEDVAYKLHDFGCRGVSSMETAGIAGAAHLAVGFKGTDTIPTLLTVKTLCRLDGWSFYSGHGTFYRNVMDKGRRRI